MSKQPVNSNYDPKRAGRYPSGNEGRLHPGLKHPGYSQREADELRKALPSKQEAR